MTKTTITINGRLYDAITGMPVASHNNQTAPRAQHSPAAAPAASSRSFSDISGHAAKKTHSAPVSQQNSTHHASHSVHQKPQRSLTLNRQATKKPAHTATRHQQEPARSPLIRHFNKVNIEPAPQATPVAKPAATPPPDHLIPPNTTPLHASLAKKTSHTAASTQHQSSKQLKEQLIRERLAEAHATQPRVEKKSFFAGKPRLASILASTLSLLILGGYFTYLNLSNISMQIASNKAGVDAEFPNYHPSGYNISGPITYAPGEVNINYKSNTNDNGFTLTQKAANWDSQAVLDNYVRKQSSTYLTFQERGMTIYTFNNKAAWSNGGILYTLDGDASLSSEQILRLASSL